MRGSLRTGFAVTAAITAAITAYVTSTLPPRALSFDSRPPATHIVGGYHIHTVRSDGTGTADEIAAAASRADLQFVILTDHGDATRTPDPPAYRHGILVIDAIELNTREGHLVALGLTEAAPYPLAGLARDVIEDVHRLGGSVVIAHPDSPRAELSWRGGQGVFAEGVEWLNVDSEWRDESASHLLLRTTQSLLRTPEAIAALFSRPDRSLQRWDAWSRARPTFGLAALDAHANVGWRESEEPRQRTVFARPTYESLFRTVAQTVIIDAGLSGDARIDASRVLSAILTGQSYSTIRAQAWPSALQFSARQGDAVHPMGSRLTDVSQPVQLTATVPTAPGVRVTLLRDGQPMANGQGHVDVSDIVQPGVYRVEAYLPDAKVPWIVSNPITIGGRQGPPAGPQPASSGSVGQVVEHPVALESPTWRLEHDPSSEGSTRIDDGRLRFDYRLGDGVPRGQYVSAVYEDTSGAGLETIRFVAQASAPMRVSIQVRLPEGHGRTAQRWQRSAYLDRTPRTVTLRLQDFDPADRPVSRRPIVTPIQSLLIVADTVNTLPGSSGTVWLSDLTVGINRLDP